MALDTGPIATENRFPCRTLAARLDGGAVTRPSAGDSGARTPFGESPSVGDEGFPAYKSTIGDGRPTNSRWTQSIAGAACRGGGLSRARPGSWGMGGQPPPSPSPAAVLSF